ncbi:hypothetical protein DFH29DRAFT_984041 [Suillus ampliporus]|nr:hypothetical protein DFH29DRAFT_984041 [Suillus ampliporus]
MAQLPQQQSDSDRKDDTAAARAKRSLIQFGCNVHRQSNSNVHKGRGIRRLISLFNSLEDLVAENDRREELLQSLDSQDELVTSRDEDRTFSSFNELLHCLPWLKKKLLSDAKELDSILKELRKGADSARGDDTANLKHANSFIHWTPPFAPQSKMIAGLFITPPGMLLTKDKIRDRDSDFLVTTYSWPAFMYKDYSFDSANIEKGLFRSTLLLKAFKHLFTSPSSAKEIDGDGNVLRRMTRSTLRFALSNINSWRSVDGDFDYYDFYNNIVDFFEVVPGTDAQAPINELLKWWNRKVFRKIRTVPLTSAQLGRFSVARMSSQREVHEGDSP